MLAQSLLLLLLLLNLKLKLTVYPAAQTPAETLKQIIKNRQARRAKLKTSEVVAEANKMTGSPTGAAAASDNRADTSTKSTKTAMATMNRKK